MLRELFEADRQLPLLVALLDALERRAERLAACRTHVNLVDGCEADLDLEAF